MSYVRSVRVVLHKERARDNKRRDAPGRWAGRYVVQRGYCSSTGTASASAGHFRRILRSRDLPGIDLGAAREGFRVLCFTIGGSTGMVVLGGALFSLVSAYVVVRTM